MKPSSYKDIPVPVIGQSYQHRSRGLSIQRTINLIPQANDDQLSPSLTTWPGCQKFNSLTGRDRGATVFSDELYKVNDNTLFKIDSDGVDTSIGTIAGTNRCVFANDGTSLIITTGSTGYIYDGATLSAISDGDFQNGNSVTYINQQMLYDGNGGKFQVSDVGLPASIQPNNFATAESAPDDTIRVFAFKDRVFIFGNKTIETWYNTGSGNPPFGRVNGGTMNIGLGAIHSVASTEDYAYFLGDDKRVYRFSSPQPQNITPVAISHQLDLMTDVSDCIGTVVTIEGQNIILFSFNTGDRTFAYNETAGAWFELTTGIEEKRYTGQQSLEVYGKRLLTDKDGGISELKLDLMEDNGAIKVQERIFGPINGEKLGAAGQRILMSHVDFDIETGVGTITGQGINPKLMASISIDDGDTFTNEDDIDLGRSGAGSQRVRWNNFVSFYTCYVRIRLTDPVLLSVYGASMGVKGSGY